MECNEGSSANSYLIQAGLLAKAEKLDGEIPLATFPYDYGYLYLFP